MTTYRYNWLHIPTGKRGVGEVYQYSFQYGIEIISKENFLALLEHWNRIGDGRWMYYAE